MADVAIDFGQSLRMVKFIFAGLQSSASEQMQQQKGRAAANNSRLLQLRSNVPRGSACLELYKGLVCGSGRNCQAETNPTSKAEQRQEKTDCEQLSHSEILDSFRAK